MSLAIDIDKVRRVLLADGWHEVADNEEGMSSFNIDAYEYLWEQEIAHNDGTGFGFIDADTGTRLCGPVASIIAVADDDQ